MFDGQTVISDNVRDTLKNSIKNHKIPLKINTGEFCQNQNASLNEMGHFEWLITLKNLP